MIPQTRRTDFFVGKTLLQVLCPTCSYDYVHFEEPRRVSGEDSYRAWAGRGECVRLPFWGECDHTWELCIGYHKGQAFMFVEPTEPADVQAA